MLGPAKIPLVFLLITFSILVVQIECRLSSQFSMSEAIEEAKGKDTEKGVHLPFLLNCFYVRVISFISSNECNYLL